MTSMVACDGTRPAALRSPRCFRSTIGAMLGVFGWTGEFASVRFLVTRNAQSHPVIDGEREVGELSQGLYVMGLNVAFFTALLAGVVITQEYRLAPVGEVAFILAASSVCCDAAFPCRSLFARKHLSATGPRAESGAFVSAIERLAAIFALSWLRGVSGRPTLFGAVMRRVSTIGFDKKFFTALLAYLGNLRVLHISIIPHNTQICTSYVAERWSVHTGRQPVLVDI